MTEPEAPLDEARLRELLPGLRRFALQLTRDVHAADDLVQGCLERALSRWQGRRTGGDLRAWLFSILYRQFVDGHRRARRLSRLLELIGAEHRSAESPEETVIAQSMLEAFARLPHEQRALLLLVSVEGLSYRQAADALGIPIGTIMSRLSRARTALRRLADGEHAAPALRIVK